MSRQDRAAQASENEPQLNSHQACLALTSLLSEQLSGHETSLKSRGFTKHSLIWAADGHPEAVFCLASGQIHIVEVHPGGSETLIRRVLPGDLFGEFCYCPERRRGLGTMAVAVTNSRVTEMSYPTFHKLMCREPSLFARLMSQICEDQSEMEQRMRILSLHDARERLGRLLLHLGVQRSGPDADTRKKVVLTIPQGELAALAALSRPHVTVLMNEFRRRGLVSYLRGLPVTVHVAALTASLKTVDKPTVFAAAGHRNI